MTNSASESAAGRPAEHQGWTYLGLICFVATLGGLLFGYDTAVISGAIGFLKQHFGLSAAGMGWAAACALYGCVVGVALAKTGGGHPDEPRFRVQIRDRRAAGETHARAQPADELGELVGKWALERDHALDALGHQLGDLLPLLEVAVARPVLHRAQ